MTALASPPRRLCGFKRLPRAERESDDWRRASMTSKRLAVAAVSALLGAIAANAAIVPTADGLIGSAIARRLESDTGAALESAIAESFGEPGPSGPFSEPVPPERPLLKPMKRGNDGGALRMASLAGSGAGLALAAFGLGSIATAVLDGPDLRAAHRGLAFAASGAALAGLSALLYAEPEP